MTLQHDEHGGTWEVESAIGISARRSIVEAYTDDNLGSTSMTDILRQIETVQEGYGRLAEIGFALTRELT